MRFHSGCNNRIQADGEPTAGLSSQRTATERGQRSLMAHWKMPARGFRVPQAVLTGGRVVLSAHLRCYCSACPRYPYGQGCVTMPTRLEPSPLNSFAATARSLNLPRAWPSTVTTISLSLTPERPPHRPFTGWQDYPGLDASELSTERGGRRIGKSLHRRR
jgi:hypothetical protein